jgi:hypothetical protein
MLVGPSFCHPDQGLIFYKIKGLGVNFNKADVYRLRRTAAGARFYGTRVLGSTAVANPDQFNIAQSFSCHGSSFCRLSLKNYSLKDELGPGGG